MEDAIHVFLLSQKCIVALCVQKIRERCENDEMCEGDNIAIPSIQIND